MAIANDVIIAFISEEGGTTIELANTRSEYASCCFDIPQENGSKLEVDAGTLQWSNYFKAGFRGAMEVLDQERQKENKGRARRTLGIKALVDGTVPPGSGLSSSAAFVVAATIATLHVHGMEALDKHELVATAIASERLVGVNSGGMDQAASVFGRADHALLVAFVPDLTATAFRLPAMTPDPAFVIANTLVTADKHTTGPVHYNLRVVEVTFAAELLVSLLGLDRQRVAIGGPLGITLRGVMDAHLSDQTTPTLSLSGLDEMSHMVKTLLVKDGYTLEEIAAKIGMTTEEVKQRYLTEFPVRAETFKLRQRAMHVFAEARRVLEFREALLHPPANRPLIRVLGEIMDRCQRDCDALFDCSCPETEELCRLAREHGAYGARSAGAGWGGCCLFLVARTEVDTFLHAIEEGYYRKHFTIDEAKLRQALYFFLLDGD